MYIILNEKFVPMISNSNLDELLETVNSHFSLSANDVVNLLEGNFVDATCFNSLSSLVDNKLTQSTSTNQFWLCKFSICLLKIADTQNQYVIRDIDSVIMFKTDHKEILEKFMITYCANATEHIRYIYDMENHHGNHFHFTTIGFFIKQWDYDGKCIHRLGRYTIVVSRE